MWLDSLAATLGAPENERNSPHRRNRPMGLVHRFWHFLGFSSSTIRKGRNAAGLRARRQRFLEPLEDRRVMAVLINEFVVNHVGTDSHEYVEILADPNTDLSSLTLVQIDGDGG